ncbi:HD domain-containing phosphohydrolase [Deinococcus aquatilis]|jgi:diguanylate cyclase (GGDEF)-like protein|uniref:HD domain-containing phosphohydrolase n=1 Tax=Deinococcus aquatilis TaxID=519440 RepID=UPI00037809E2|nr:HD domain-containing phosphohydrolase [Deinococcus aquatilis]
MGFAEVLFNFCLLVTCIFGLSLTYREWPVRRRIREHALRVGLASAFSLLLMVFSLQDNGFRFDLRLVPLALIAVRYGMGVGALAALPLILWRWLEGWQGGVAATINIASMLLIVGLLRSRLQILVLTPQNIWLLPLPFMAVNLVILAFPEGRAMFWQVYPLGLLLNTTGLGMAAVILLSRFELLRVTHAFRTQALTDPLTGLGNRRQFDTDLAALDVGAQLVLLDLDHFKVVNDRYGHHVGDQALQGVAQVLGHDERQQVRAYRVGGEEFALLTDLGSESRACALAESVLTNVAGQGMALAGVSASSDLPLATLTLSAGLATRRPHELPHDLFRRADEALYLAKTQGRNRLVCSTDLSHPPATAASRQVSSAAVQANVPLVGKLPLVPVHAGTDWEASELRSIKAASAGAGLARQAVAEAISSSAETMTWVEADPQEVAPLKALPRFTLWQSLRTTVDLLSQHRSITDADWAELLRLAIACVGGAEAGSLNVREGREFRLCAVEGYDSALVGLRLSEQSELSWYGMGRENWQKGTARVLNAQELPQAWAQSDPLYTEGQDVAFQTAGRRSALKASLCLPVVLGGEVVAHLNVESFTSEHAFTAASIEVAGTFTQQLAALLQFQQRWRELDLLAGLHLQLQTDGGLAATTSGPLDFSSLQDETRLESHLTETALDLLHAHQATLLRYDPALDQLNSRTIEGHYRDLGPVRLPRGQGLSWAALETGKIMRSADIRADQRIYRREQLGQDSMMTVPLFGQKHDPLGVLVVTRDAHRPFQPADENLGLMLASVGSRMLERYAHVNDLREALEAALNTLGVALEVRDFETQGHTQRVRHHAHVMGQALNLPENRLVALRHGAALHDIGKLGISDAVLLKPGRLTPDERLIMETHAPLGAVLAARIPYLHPEAHAVIRHHHERWDGAGYPDRLGGEQIPLLARLFSLCDVYDALVSTRPYKQAMPPAQALEIIRAGRGTQFDPELTDLFVKLWEAGEIQ